jgi:hypothetical protein
MLTDFVFNVTVISRLCYGNDIYIVAVLSLLLMFEILTVNTDDSDNQSVGG